MGQHKKRQPTAAELREAKRISDNILAVIGMRPDPAVKFPGLEEAEAREAEERRRQRWR